MQAHPLRAAFQWTEARLDTIFGTRWNPLYQLGALGFFYYWVVAVTGVYVYVFFDTGTTEAFDSVEYLTVEQWYLGGVMRSLHRYASDGMVLMMVVHTIRELAYGRFRGPRWFTWVTGLPIAGFVIVSGISGYWLVWDRLAQYIAIESSEWFDALGLFGEPIARNFLTPASLDDRFFTLLMFIHIVVPLLLLLVLWIHLLRVSRPQINPGRGLAIGTFAMLVALSIAKPAVSHAPADLATLPGLLQLDWFYLPGYPLLELLSDRGVWVLLACVTLVLAALPWLPPRPARQPVAVVHLESCNGCGRCADDCPSEAILMQPRSDGLPFKTEAVVDASLCVSCGICGGACPTATPFRRRSALIPGIELPEPSVETLRRRVVDALDASTAGPRIVVLGCDHGISEAMLAPLGLAVVRAPCIAAFPPSFIDFALSGLADGVVVCGCRDGGCIHRFGPEFTEARVAGHRDPYLRKRVPRERLKLIWAGPGEAETAIEAIERFRRSLAGIAPEPLRAEARAEAEAEEPEGVA